MRRRRTWGVADLVLGGAALLALAVTVVILWVLVGESWAFFREVGLGRVLGDTVWTPLFSDKRYGIWPLVVGTLLTSLVALLVAGPLGLILAIYLAEFCNPLVVRWVRPLLEFIAGIPTVVLGFIALFVVTPFLQRLIPELPMFNALSPGLVMGFMILPTVLSLSYDALRGVSETLREASKSLGAHKITTAFRVVVPAAASGIIVSLILGFARAIGETMIVAMAAGQQHRISFDPVGPIETMTSYIAKVAMGDIAHDSIEYRSIFVVGFGLFVLTLGCNLTALAIRRVVDGGE